MFFALAQFIIGLLVVGLGAEWLVKSSVRLSRILSIAPVIVGLTIVSFGTSAPELAVGISASLSGQMELAVGNIVGSNIFNILVIVGLSALLKPILVHSNIIRMDLPIMLGASILFLIFAQNGSIHRIEGSFLGAGLIAYIALQIWLVKKGKTSKAQEELEEILEEGPTTLPKGQSALIGLLFVVGLAALVLGAQWMVSGATTLAQWFGVSELLIGLTIVAIGTSIPEVATSVVAALRGHSDIAIGNAVGSNIFNIFAVGGICAFVSPLPLVVSAEALQIDTLIMIGAALLCLPLFLSNFRVDRWEGLAMLGLYGLYLFNLYVRGVGGDGTPSFFLNLGLLLLFALISFIYSWATRNRPAH